MKLKVGDRVVGIDMDNRVYTITIVDSSILPYCLDDLHWSRADEVVLESIYLSPVYQLLKEEK